jgi:ribosomal protein S18 acetylase RimI-like enzyme
MTFHFSPLSHWSCPLVVWRLTSTVNPLQALSILNSMRLWKLLVFHWLFVTRTSAFQHVFPFLMESFFGPRISRHIPFCVGPMRLIPIRAQEQEFTFLEKPDRYRGCIDRHGKLDRTEYELSLVEESDLVNVARFVVQVFGADAISVSKNLTSFEKMLMMPAADLVNGYSSIVAFAEVYAGLRSRLANQLNQQPSLMFEPPNISGLTREEQLRVAACSSIVLVLGKVSPSTDNCDDNHVIATVELRLQPCDAKIPFSLPWIDRIERRLASFLGFFGGQRKVQHDLQPYLSNLCVDDAYRGMGIGRALVRCVENIAATNWGYSKMFLHVDLDNQAALQLYKTEGYKDVGRRWNPFWAGRSADIGYFVKRISA